MNFILRMATNGWILSGMTSHGHFELIYHTYQEALVKITQLILEDQ